MWDRVIAPLSRLAVLLAAILVIAAMVTSMAGQADATVIKPWVRNGWKQGPVGLPAIEGEVARLALPAGKFVVFAKTYFYSPASSELGCNLRLASWSKYDHARALVPAQSAGSMSLNVAGTLGSPDAAILSCSSSQPGAQIHWIEITAIKAGTLSIVEMQ